MAEAYAAEPVISEIVLQVVSSRRVGAIKEGHTRRASIYHEIIASLDTTEVS